MHIYYLIQYFPPELNGGATRASEMARMWAEQGHHVTVLTGFPNHPHGKIPAQYRGKLFLEEQVDNYTIRRSFIYAVPNKGKIKRIFNHLSLAISTFVGSIFKKKPDVIIASSPPIFLGFSGYLLSKFRRVPYIFEVRDVWPQQAVDLGMLKNKQLIKLLEKYEQFLYFHAAKVVGVTNGMRDHFLKTGVPNNKIEIVSNGTDLNIFTPGIINEHLKAELGLSGKFLVSYIGTMGLSQGLSFVLKAAKQLQVYYPKIHFLFVGDGAERDNLISLSKELNLTNITFLPSQARSNIPDLYRLSDVAMVLLKNLPIFYHAKPSKLFEIMACGVPIILGVAGDVQQAVKEAEAGLCIEPENAQQLSDAIINIYTHEELKEKFKLNSRQYVRDHYNRQTLASKYLDILEQFVNK
jgi:glycosyltransferase involved in cell wall biosynthesis